MGVKKLGMEKLESGSFGFRFEIEGELIIICVKFL